MKLIGFPRFCALALGTMAFLLSVNGSAVAATSSTAQRTFTSPTDAKNALLQAARTHDRQSIDQMFGPEVTNLLTGDKVLDDDHFEQFAKDLSERCELIPRGNGVVTLEIGNNSWPFPIPLVQTNGAWVFDTPAGEQEIIDRHIGRDEYYAIGVCRAYVNAQRQYASRFSQNGTPTYATQLECTPGKMDGLCWAAENGSRSSPLSAVVAQAGQRSNNGRGPLPFHGYVFKILTRQGPAAPGGRMDYVHNSRMTGGFALVAYPVRWGESGIMTFIVNQDGTVYQKSLGENTARTAAQMKEFNPDESWSVVTDPGITDLTANESSRKPMTPR
ncbi:MAG TPA: DUF2950 domain-containing protein [Verrucomicrobiae bacterium]|nr:DUF2950 domain-containing protein [Verrucomicrobiae bacterium]